MNHLATTEASKTRSFGFSATRVPQRSDNLFAGRSDHRTAFTQGGDSLDDVPEWFFLSKGEVPGSERLSQLAHDMGDALRALARQFLKPAQRAFLQIHMQAHRML